MLDAADAVLGGLEVVRDELVIGDAIGDVPAEAPQVPLARDLAAAQRAARLKPEPVLKTIELDVRTPNGRRRSHLLHRLVALGIPWGIVEEGRGSSGTFRETWRVAWDPELSVRVVEQAGHGTTVAGAATSVLVERAAAATRLPEATEIVALTLLADLPQAIGPAVHRLGQLAANAPDVAELMDAMGPLATALRYGDARGTEASATAGRVRRARGARLRLPAAGDRRHRRRRGATHGRAPERGPGGPGRGRPPGTPRHLSRRARAAGRRDACPRRDPGAGDPAAA